VKPESQTQVLENWTRSICNWRAGGNKFLWSQTVPKNRIAGFMTAKRFHFVILAANLSGNCCISNVQIELRIELQTGQSSATINVF
jgi:hypothetical protein